MIFAACSSLLLALTIPPLGWYPLGWFALAPFLYYIIKANGTRRVFFAGYLFGIIYLGVLFWGMNELAFFAPFWAHVGYAALLLYYGFYFALFALLASKLSRQSAWSPFFLAALWVLIEYLRSLGPFGTTLGVLGYTQTDFLVFAQSASAGGVYFLSFILVLFNATLAVNFKPEKRGGIKGVLAVVLILLAVFGYGYLRMGENHLALSGTKFSLRIVQPNISQVDKLSAAKSWEIIQRHETLTQASAEVKLDLAIWPETAVTEYLVIDRMPAATPYAEELSRFVAKQNIPLLTGAPYWDGEHAFNSAFILSNAGVITGRFDKARLVPFGEYLLFRNLLYPLVGKDGLFSQDFSFGSSEAVLLRSGSAVFATGICFESTYPDLIRERVNAGGNVVLVITNDAWFGASSVADQHLQIGRLRAIENDRYLIQCGNTGYSAFVDPRGRIISKSKLLEAQVLDGAVMLRETKTIYGRFGDWILWLSLLLFLGMGFLRRR